MVHQSFALYRILQYTVNSFCKVFHKQEMHFLVNQHVYCIHSVGFKEFVSVLIL